jgi:hypothetical protein
VSAVDAWREVWQFELVKREDCMMEGPRCS